MPTSEYKYIAFISYKREDEKWAKWLQNKLESYSLPTTLRKENPCLPAKIRPIFRDQSELAGGNLKEEIEKGLSSSKYLIVVCSPRAAKSPWVSKEVQWFIDNGRENDIIPFIVGGTANAANPEDECFPEGLRKLNGERELLGINIDEMGQEAALIKVVARMFELKFDSLWQRYERAKRRKRLFVLTGILIFALACLGVGGRMTYLNNEIAKERDRANAEAVRANKERDSAVRANQSLQIANDSIIRQSDIISQTNADLERKKRQLEETNIRLAEERDRVIEARKISDKNYTALASKTIIELWDKGEHLNAVAFARDVYNKYPHTVDLEQAYWHCLLNADYVNVCELDMKEKIKSIYHDKCSDYTAILTDWHIYIVKINNTIEIEKSYRLPQIFSEYLDIVYNRDNDILIASCSSGFCVYNSSNEVV